MSTLFCKTLQDDVGEVWYKNEFHGEILGKNAAGSSANRSTWMFNDQFRVKVTESTPMFVSCMQHDVRLDGLNKYPNGIGLELQKTEDCSLPCLTAPVSSEVFCLTYNKGRDVSKFLILPPGEYAFVTSTFIPGQEVVYYLVMYTLRKIQVERLIYQNSTVKGQWTSQSGGSIYHSSWQSNPMYLLVAPPNLSKYEFKLGIWQNDTRSPHPVGVYLFRHYQKGHTPSREQLVQEFPPTANKMVEQRFSLDASDGPFLMMPFTHNPGQAGSYEITIFTRKGESFLMQPL